MKRIHILQHVPFETPGHIPGWAEAHSHALSFSRLYQVPHFPHQDEFDALIILGGPMGVGDSRQYPWLTGEKRFVESTAAQGKPVLGICLGAQVLAETLGGSVKRNPFKEIGWFEIRLAPGARNLSSLDSFPDAFTTLHWHGDTFEIPPGSVRIGESDATSNQGFASGRMIGLQFHMEITR